MDYHVHLEEGPYSPGWWTRTLQAVLAFQRQPHPDHSLQWIRAATGEMDHRLKQGAYSSGWLDFYLRRAKELGLKEVGIVDHLYRFRECGDFYREHIHLRDDELGRLQKTWFERVSCVSMDEFVSTIENEKEKWKKEGVALKLGIEADYFPGAETELKRLLSGKPWDFVIGSVHFIDGWGFDNPGTQYLFEQKDLKTLYDRHFTLVEQAAASGCFDVVAHLDNLKVFGHRPEDESELVSWYHQIARTLQRCQVATELNTGLSYRYSVREMCPSPLFLRVLSAYKVPVTLSSDAHFPDDLGMNLQGATRLLRDAGYRTVSTFSGRVRSELTL